MQRKRDYKYIIFDADHTLLNYLADERCAYQRLYEKLGVEISEDLLKQSRKHSEESWTDAGLYEVSSEYIQKHYHTLYRTHTEEIFNRLFLDFPSLREKGNAKALGLAFLSELISSGNAIDGAMQTVDALSKNYRLCVATNGLSQMQRARLAPFLAKIDRLYISEEVGAIKPLPAFFEFILRDLNARAEECLMVGDSLHSDILGGKRAGMDCCWFTPKKIENDGGIQPDYQINDLKELISILR